MRAERERQLRAQLNWFEEQSLIQQWSLSTPGRQKRWEIVGYGHAWALSMTSAEVEIWISAASTVYNRLDQLGRLQHAPAS